MPRFPTGCELYGAIMKQIKYVSPLRSDQYNFLFVFAEFEFRPRALCLGLSKYIEQGEQ